ncbi:MAG: isoprenyl transferase [Ruminococcaceae bacterium]|nr:isoprenyl transferase [Oscillospiraceae bacterium]
MESEIDKSLVPVHIGIIMDGNGRWAKKRRLPRTSGHYKGAEVFKKITRYCKKIGISVLTVFAFSTENWQRPKEEVNSIMNLLRTYLVDAFGFKDENIKIRFIGNREALDEDIVKKMEELESVSKDFDGMTLNIAVNYSGRTDVLQAARRLAESVKEGALEAENIDEKEFSKYLYTYPCPDPDLIIRPSGECRLSNFMLWQSAYTEFVFMDILWPDFTERDLDKAIEEYINRDRRFGKI